jgi:hypothetical protein
LLGIILVFSSVTAETSPICGGCSDTCAPGAFLGFGQRGQEQGREMAMIAITTNSSIIKPERRRTAGGERIQFMLDKAE